MELAGDPAAFGLLSLEKPARQHPQFALTLPHGLLHALLLCDVDTGADVPVEGAIRLESRHARVEDPAVFAIEPSQAVFHAESLACVKGPTVGVQTALYIVPIDALAPAVTDLSFQWPAGEVEPWLIEVRAQLV